MPNLPLFPSKPDWSLAMLMSSLLLHHEGADSIVQTTARYMWKIPVSWDYYFVSVDVVNENWQEWISLPHL